MYHTRSNFGNPTSSSEIFTLASVPTPTIGALLFTWSVASNSEKIESLLYGCRIHSTDLVFPFLCCLSKVIATLYVLNHTQNRAFAVSAACLLRFHYRAVSFIFLSGAAERLLTKLRDIQVTVTTAPPGTFPEVFRWGILEMKKYRVVLARDLKHVFASLLGFYYSEFFISLFICPFDVKFMMIKANFDTIRVVEGIAPLLLLF